MTDFTPEGTLALAWFRAYEAVRQSGVTNMFDVRRVCALAGMEREQVLYVMKNYSMLKEQYGKEVQP